MTQDAGLTDTNGIRIALKSVHIEGRIEGPLATMTVTQRYHNDTGEKLEIINTFPLAWGGAVLGMNVTLGDNRLHGVVMEKWLSRSSYETAVEAGNTPVMVEMAAPGLYTANMGNIEDGEDMTVEIRHAQLLRFIQGQARLRIPCVVAPRYGDQHKEGGLAPHESVEADLLTEYPLTIRIALPEWAAKARVHCPSHAYSIEETESGRFVCVNSGAMLDRDFVLSFDGVTERSFALLAPDGDRHVMLAAFSPELPEPSRPVHLKILVDCSGSMAGDGMAQAKEAVRSVLRELKAGDYVSYSRFGGTARHESVYLLPWSPDTLERVTAALEDTQADMGSVDMAHALRTTLEYVGTPDAGSARPCVLLITGGSAWNAAKLLRYGQKSDQRIFVIGTGSAPAENTLRELAEKTGGVCECVSPNEDMGAAATRMIRRMRGCEVTSSHVDWGEAPEWETSLPGRIYSGDMIYAYASFASPPTRVPVLRWEMDREERQLPAEKVEHTENEAVFRLSGAKRLAGASSPEDERNIALIHQLVCGHSSLLLTHAGEGVRSSGFPLPHQVRQMMAAGHAGFGTAVSHGQRFIAPNYPKTNLVPLPLGLLYMAELELARTPDIEEVLRNLAAEIKNPDVGHLVGRISEQENLPLEYVRALLLHWLLHSSKENHRYYAKLKQLLAKYCDSMSGAYGTTALEKVMPAFSEFFYKER